MLIKRNTCYLINPYIYCRFPIPLKILLWKRYPTLNFLVLLLMINFLGNLIIIDHICQVISRNIGVINRLNFYLPLSSLFHIYHSLLLPYLHYGLLAWGNTHHTLILLLQKNSIAAQECPSYYL